MKIMAGQSLVACHDRIGKMRYLDQAAQRRLAFESDVGTGRAKHGQVAAELDAVTATLFGKDQDSPSGQRLAFPSMGLRKVTGSGRRPRALAPFIFRPSL